MNFLLRNYLHSFILLAGMLGMLSLIGWLLAGPSGTGWFLLAGMFAFLSAPRLTPHLVMRLHRAQELPPESSPQLYDIVHRLARRAGLKTAPALYYLPSNIINAFTTGLHNSAVIAVSDGMLRQLTVRELTGVLAHEISHISNNDLLVMMIADVIRRLTSIMAFIGYMLVWVYIPLFVLTSRDPPWLLLIVLVTAPTFSVLMQLALSRTHEFNADARAARLTGDPLGLASALEKIDYSQGGWVRRMFSPSQQMHEPVVFRTHPLMIDRVARLREMASVMQATAAAAGSGDAQNGPAGSESDEYLRGRFLR
jgi:heat shock protein HtpX